MKYNNLGKSGLKVSRLCLGMMTYGSPTWRQWILPEEQGRPIVHRAMELGINFFDTADMYSVGVSEEILGRIIRESGKRDQWVIATKVFFPMSDDPNDRGLSRKHILSSIDASLRRLQMDYVDLYQIHRFDPETPIEETMEALNDVVRSGKARYIGGSSMFAYQFSKTLYTSDLHDTVRFISMQNHYNLVYREEEREMIPLCLSEGIGLIPWSPLARGFLAGNRNRETKGETLRAQKDEYAHMLYYQDSDFKIVDRVAELAISKGTTAAKIALAWILHKPGVAAPIIGASKIKQLEESVEALNIELTPQEISYLEELYQPHPILGHH
ncbi:MAG TPA: aldo/keto reductase [Acidobacteriota bacterium]|nr:aldo/keto reductase [Acidobacteriota bacterium]